jgi:hypothetical protein
MLQLLIGGFIAVTVLYGLLSVYFRSVHREDLENRFDAGGADGLREDFVRQGMATYDRSLRKRALRLVYVVPVVLIVAIAYVVNHS